MGLGVALVLLSAVVAEGVAAKPSGAGSGDGSGNRLGAKSCQKGGWQNLAGSDGASFASGAECNAYVEVSGPGRRGWAVRSGRNRLGHTRRPTGRGDRKP
jgi:hypothetical protein